MVRQYVTTIGAIAVLLLGMNFPQKAYAASGIFASGGGKKTAGQQFTITVTASGTEFDSLQGTISVSGPVSIVSFSAGSATWLPGKSPANGAQFVGITSATSSLTVARITLKGTKEGSGKVSVSGAQLARKGEIVGTSSGNADFTITRAPTPPGSISVSSSSHPDQNQSYTATTVELSWQKASGVTGFSYLIDQTADTTPPDKTTSADTSVKYEGQSVGTHYFHIRAQNGDGWGPTTHFKVTIKEPDAVVDSTLTKTTIASIKKAPTWQTDLQEGTATGIVFSGKGQPGYQINLAFTPSLTLPEGKTLTAEVNEQGGWEYTSDFPIKAGFYKLVAQGQKDKTLTPPSEEQRFEISLANGGKISLLTDGDAKPPQPTVSTIVKTHGLSPRLRYGLIGLGTLLIVVLGTILIRLRLLRRH